jgi:hypothetical protein
LDVDRRLNTFHPALSTTDADRFFLFRLPVSASCRFVGLPPAAQRRQPVEVEESASDEYTPFAPGGS